MQLTRHTDYALRVLMYLGAQNERKASVAEISEYYAISHNHLAKIVQDLTRYGFVTTIRGKYGGIQLGRDADEISVGNVIRKMETNFDIVECFDRANNDCVIDKTCRLRSVLRGSVNNFLRELDEVSLADILKPKLRSELIKIQNR